MASMDKLNFITPKFFGHAKYFFLFIVIYFMLGLLVSQKPSYNIISRNEK